HRHQERQQRDADHARAESRHAADHERAEHDAGGNGELECAVSFHALTGHTGLHSISAIMSIPAQLQRLADGIGAAVALPTADMARGIRAALREATTGERWLPLERRRANHERYARHLLYGDPAG